MKTDKLTGWNIYMMRRRVIVAILTLCCWTFDILLTAQRCDWLQLGRSLSTCNTLSQSSLQ